MKYASLGIIVLASIILVSCSPDHDKKSTSKEVKQEISTPVTQTETPIESEETVIAEVVETTATQIVEKVKQEVEVEVEQETITSKTPVVEADPVVSEVVEEPETVVTGGKYVSYSDALVGISAHTVIYFHADWCPTCVRLEKDIQSGTIPNDLNILKADFDTSKELKKKYGVTSQTTLIHVSPEGELIKKWVGGDLEDIIENVEG